MTLVIYVDDTGNTDDSGGIRTYVDYTDDTGDSGDIGDTYM